MKDISGKKAGYRRWSVPAIVFLGLVLALVIGSVYLRHREAERARLNLKKRQIRVEVLNGTEVERLALKAGFDVVEVDNAEDRSFEETVVVDRTDNRAANAALVARELNCKNIIPQLEPTLLLEVTVILGKDYSKEKKVRFLGIF